MQRLSVVSSSAALSASLIVAILVGCSSAPAASSPTPAATSTATQQPGATTGDPSADGLCVAFTPALATTALGVPVAAPQSGDVLPRPNGVYCHYNAADGSANVEAQLKPMTESEFDALAETIDTTEPVSGAGVKAFKRDTSITGDVGVTVAAWSEGQGVTVSIYNPNGQQAPMLAAALAIAQAVLAT
jgi:hypothetical protein